MNTEKKDKIDICVNCGYEKAVHRFDNFACPADDPYLGSFDRKWHETNVFEESV